MTMSFRTIAAAALCAAVATPLAAAAARVGAITISVPWARETAPGQANGGGFLTIANTGKTDDRLLGASSPVAREVQLHSMEMDGSVMRMRQVTGGIAVPARQTIMLKPGSFHLMFIGLKQPLKRGEAVPVTLRFERAGTIKVRLAVQSVGAMEAGHGRH